MSFGLDYAWSRPSVSAMKAADVEFICRYLSNDPTKDLSRAEATAASKAGISCVAVWETTTGRPKAGRAAGIEDAKRAAAKAEACGMPNDRPIYFAIDYDAPAGDQAVINAYLDGAASVIGRDRVGAYAGYYPLKRCFDAGKITWGWQTYAWSGGKWDSRAHIQQYKNGVTFDGKNVDYNRSTKADFGQWKVGESPDMPLSDTDKKWILENVTKAIFNVDGVIPNPTDNPDNKEVTAKWILSDIHRRVQAANSGIAALTAAVAQLDTPDVDEVEIAAAVLSGLRPETIADTIATTLGPDLAQTVVDVLRARLES